MFPFALSIASGLISQIPAAASAIFGLGRTILSNRFGQLVAVAGVAFWLGGVHKQDVLTSGFDAAGQKERSARDFAIKQAATQAHDDADQIDKLEDQLKRNFKENRNAARANYRKPCLDVGGVRRLSEIN